MIVNLNQTVLVRLFPAGEQRLDALQRRLTDSYRQDGLHAAAAMLERWTWRDAVQPDGRYRTQFWMLMRDFGELMSMGQADLFHLDVDIVDEPVYCRDAIARGVRVIDFGDEDEP